MNSSVQFPITILFSEGGQEIYDDEMDVCLNLEYFDSSKGCSVKDATGKPVWLVVDALQIKRCEIA